MMQQTWTEYEARLRNWEPKAGSGGGVDGVDRILKVIDEKRGYQDMYVL